MQVHYSLHRIIRATFQFPLIHLLHTIGLQHHFKEYRAGPIDLEIRLLLPQAQQPGPHLHLLREVRQVVSQRLRGE